MCSRYLEIKWSQQSMHMQRQFLQVQLDSIAVNVHTPYKELVLRQLHTSLIQSKQSNVYDVMYEPFSINFYAMSKLKNNIV